MKTIKALMILCMVCSYWAAFAVEEKPGPDAVVSKVLPQAMPHETTKRTEFLWDNFANKPDADQFSNYTSGNWTNNFAAFASNLVAKAKAQKLNSEALRKTLTKVFEHSKGLVAYLPVGAYQTTLDSRSIWIITVKWETLMMGVDAHLVHIRMFAFDQTTLELVEYSTCN
jgi:hypothetical protein